MIDDHFWPSMYPGIVVGLLVGLAGGSLLSTILGAAGGLAGAMLLFFIFAWLGLEDSILSLIGLVGGAVLGAYRFDDRGQVVKVLLRRAALAATVERDIVRRLRRWIVASSSARGRRFVLLFTPAQLAQAIGDQRFLGACLQHLGVLAERRRDYRQALDYYQRFLQQRGEDPTIRDDLALTHFRIGRITEEIDSPERALASYRRARDMQRELASVPDADPARRGAWGDTLSAIGRVLHRMQRLDEALAVRQQAVAIRRQLAPGNVRGYDRSGSVPK